MEFMIKALVQVQAGKSSGELIHRLIEGVAKLQGSEGGRKVVNRMIKIIPNEELFEVTREVVERMVEITTPRYVQISESWREVVKWFVEFKIIH